MALIIPKSMDECLYFSNRTVGDAEIMAWVYRKECTKCHNARMGKPVKKGKVKTKAAYYECPNCHYQEEKIVHESSLKLEAKYTCPHCGKEGESTGEYKRKNYQGVSSYLVVCEHCHKPIPITKKLKKV